MRESEMNIIREQQPSSTEIPSSIVNMHSYF
jgi:hypothetical protein